MQILSRTVLEQRFFLCHLKPCSHRRFCRPTLAHCVGRLFRRVHTNKTTSADISKQCTCGADREKTKEKNENQKKSVQASDGSAIFSYCGSILPFHWRNLNLSREVRQKSADKSGKYRRVPDLSADNGSVRYTCGVGRLRGVPTWKFRPTFRPTKSPV